MKWLKRTGYTLLGLFVFLNIVVAFHAYKFTHFYPVTTWVKKPEEMTGWEKSKAVLMGVNYPKSRIKEMPTIPYQPFAVTTEDGITLRGWKLTNVDTSKGSVIMFHGHANSKSAVLKEGEAFNKMGYTVYMVDFRAHGESDGTICTIGFNESRDVKAAYDYVTKESGNKVVLWGISLGAATVTKALADFNEIQPTKVILEMPFGTLSDAVKGRLRTMHLPEQPFATLLTFWGGAEQSFWAFSHNPEEYAKSIHCPVLIQWGVNDPRVTKKEIDQVYKNLGTADKTLVQYKTAAHESLYKKEPEKWTASVSSFLSK